MTGTILAVDMDTKQVTYTYDSDKGQVDFILNVNWEKAYKIIFDANGGNFEDKEQIVLAGQQAVRRADPTKYGYTFKGWYNGDEKWDFDKKINENITLKARWSKNVNPVIKGANSSNSINTRDDMNLAVSSSACIISYSILALIIKKHKKRN